MVLEKSLRKRILPESDSPSQDDQLCPTLEASSSSSTVSSRTRPASPGGGPQEKRARMGSVKHYGSSSQSVAQRLKESTLKQQELNTKNGTDGSVVTFKTPYPVFRDRKTLNETQKTTVRLISQYLKDLGLRESVDTLVEETGCKIEHTYGAKLRKTIVAGQWDESISILERSKPQLTATAYEEAREELIVQKALDLVNRLEPIKAVRLIRAEMVRYPKNTELSNIYRLILLNEEKVIRTEAIINFRSKGYREKVALSIEKMVPLSFMLPQGRLAHLLDQSLANQTKSCKLHFEGKKPHSLGPANLLVNHECDLEKLHNPQNIDDQMSEITAMEFTADGRMLATANSTNAIRIYRVSKKTWTLSFLKKVVHRDLVNIEGVSWSYDSRFIACIGNPSKPFAVTVFDVETGKIHRILKKVADVVFTTMSFAWGGYYLAVADEKSHFQIHDVTEPYEKESLPKACFDGFRIRQIQKMRSPHAVMALDSHNRIRKYEWRPFKDQDTLINEKSTIYAFTLHKSERYVLVSTEVNLNLWDIDNKSLVRRFVTPLNKMYIMDATFGGKDHEYIATGTPTGQILVYSINDTFPLFEIPQPSHCFNAIAWHPKAHGLFVSAASDETLRVWHFECSIPSCSNGVIEPEDCLEEYLQETAKSHKNRSRRKVKKTSGSIKAIEATAQPSEKDVSEPMEVDAPMDLPIVNQIKKKKKKRSHKKKEIGSIRNGNSIDRQGSAKVTVESSERAEKNNKSPREISSCADSDTSTKTKEIHSIIPSPLPNSVVKPQN